MTINPFDCERSAVREGIAAANDVASAETVSVGMAAVLIGDLPVGIQCRSCCDCKSKK
jgi:hypothetical protein